MMVLLQDNMLTPTQRLVALFLLWDMYKAEQITANPFLPVLLETVVKPTAVWERAAAEGHEGLHRTVRHGAAAAPSRY
jgi:hypothetical protein